MLRSRFSRKLLCFVVLALPAEAHGVQVTGGLLMNLCVRVNEHLPLGSGVILREIFSVTTVCVKAADLSLGWFNLGTSW